MANGIRTTNLERQFAIDELLGNVTADGVQKTARIPIEALTAQLAGTGAFVFGNAVYAITRAALLAFAPPNETMGGVVLNDPNPAYNGYYARVAVAWVRGRGFPDTLAFVALGGTPNAQIGTLAPGVDPSVVQEFIATPALANTGPMMLAHGGGAPKPVLNFAGNPLAAGEWSTFVRYRDDGLGNYRLTIDAASAASAAGSATSAGINGDRAEAEADRAQSYADNYGNPYLLWVSLPGNEGKTIEDYWEFLRGPQGVAGTNMPPRALFGLTLSNNVSDANNDINISAGSARDISDTVSLVLAATLTKRLDAAWAVGGGNGGLDTGSKAVNAWYHVYLIRRDSDGVIDALFSGSINNPSMPSGWTARRRLGAVTTDGSGNIRQFAQVGDYFGYVLPVPCLNAETPTVPFPVNGAVMQSLPLPLGKRLKVRLFCTFSSATAQAYLGFKDPGQGVASIADAFAKTEAATMTGSVNAEVFTNASAQIYFYGGLVTNVVIPTCYLQGFYDDREMSPA